VNNRHFFAVDIARGLPKSSDFPLKTIDFSALFRHKWAVF